MRKSASGFTIVELLVVVVVIAILAAVSTLAYHNFQRTANDNRRHSNASVIAAALEQYYNENNEYPSVASLVGKPASDVKTKLNLTDAEVLVMPGADGDTDNSLTATEAATDKLAYNGVAGGSAAEQCQTDINGGCDAFKLTWKTEAGTTETIPSAHGSTTVIADGGGGGDDDGGGTPANGGVVTTLAGSDGGYANGTGSNAKFLTPAGVAVGPDGTVYVADEGNNRIRKVTSSGVVTTLAGYGTAGYFDATGTNARFNYPEDVAVDSSGTVYVADTYNHRIRKITPSGVVTTFAGYGTAAYSDGNGVYAQFNYPFGITATSDGTLYVGDESNHRIRKITSSAVVTTLAGSTSGYADGSGTSAKFNSPAGVAVASDGTVYVADQINNRIRKITSGGVVTTLAGSGTTGSANGTGTSAQFNYPLGVAVGPDGTVYVADTRNNLIRKITPSGVVTTLAGSTQGYADGTGTSAKFYNPYGIAVDSAGTVYVADRNNDRIRMIK